MSTQQHSIPVSLPSELESPRAKLVYLYLSTVGEASVTDITDELDIKRMTAYSILDTLSTNDLIERDGDSYAAVTSRSA